MQQFEMFPRMYVDPKLDVMMVDLALQRVESNRRVTRYAILSIETIKEYLGQKNSPNYEVWTVNGVQFNACPQKVRSFLVNPKCTSCHRKGSIFIIEKDNNSDQEKYLNFYHLTKADMQGMTRDHILPASLGGKDGARNLQTMCTSCNQDKKNVMTIDEMGYVLQDLPRHAKQWADHGRLESLLFMQYRIWHTKGGSSQELRQRYEHARKVMSLTGHEKLYKRPPANLETLVAKFATPEAVNQPVPSEKAPTWRFLMVRNLIAVLLGLAFPALSYTDSFIDAHTKVRCVQTQGMVESLDGDLYEADQLKCFPALRVPVQKM